MIKITLGPFLGREMAALVEYFSFLFLTLLLSITVFMFACICLVGHVKMRVIIIIWIS